jgi:hypothetical protein
MEEGRRWGKEPERPQVAAEDNKSEIGKSELTTCGRKGGKQTGLMLFYTVLD